MHNWGQLLFVLPSTFMLRNKAMYELAMGQSYSE